MARIRRQPSNGVLGTVAFLGLGRVGSRLAAAAVRRGFATTVWNRSDGPGAALVAAGASNETSAARAARHADVVVLALGNADAVRAVLFDGPEPVADQLRSDAIVVDTSSTGPRAARAIAAGLDRRGIRFVEAPVLGSLQAATDGALTTLTGGDAHVVAGVRAVLETWTAPGRIVHMGDVGSANAARLVVMAGVGIAAEGIGEALRLGQDLRLDRARLIEAMRAGPFGPLVTDKEQQLLADDTSDARGSVDLMLADLSAALYESSSALPATEAAYLQARLAAAGGRGGHDFIEIALRRESARPVAGDGVAHART